MGLVLLYDTLFYKRADKLGDLRKLGGSLAKSILEFDVRVRSSPTFFYHFASQKT